MYRNSVRVKDIEIGCRYPTKIMGVINLSPESFYKTSVHTDVEEVIHSVQQMERDGADLIDVGARSTAPAAIYGTKEIDREDEISRVRSTLPQIVDATRCPVSIDTTSYEVAKVAIDAGASLINDVSGLRSDVRIAELAIEHGIPIVLMANCTPPCSGVNAALESLRNSLRTAINTGLTREKIILDPGIGFGKPTMADVQILRSLRGLSFLGQPILVGLSRKAFIGDILSQPQPSERLIGTVAATALAVLWGANIIRTHDVRETRETVKIVETLQPPPIMSETDRVEFIGISNPSDIGILLEEIGVSTQIRDVLEKKAAVLNILLRDVNTAAALIIKQEMLTIGGDAAYHHDVIDHAIESTDILIMGTSLHLKRLVRKIAKMNYFGLERIAADIRHVLQDYERTR